MSERGHEVRQRSQQAIRVLRDAEDWALLTVGEPSLAARFRECHECITERVLNGTYGVGLSRREMQDVVEWVDRWAWDELPQTGGIRGEDGVSRRYQVEDLTGFLGWCVRERGGRRIAVFHLRSEACEYARWRNELDSQKRDREAQS